MSEKTDALKKLLQDLEDEGAQIRSSPDPERPASNAIRGVLQNLPVSPNGFGAWVSWTKSF
jgi:hypothetical protein